MTRLQGYQFQEMRSKLEILGYQITAAGNIKAIMKRKGSKARIGGSNKYLYKHYLNDEEVKRFKQSEYFKTNEPLTDEQVYARSIKESQKYKERCAKRAKNMEEE